ncbi:MAG TPA: RagB/SusD family nutrient uptake outer membrane protein [Arachidicoccus soli]|nr:RagB/SusD family nutrient uptake outer membrane protein [Arachidicoccus soli]
MRVNRKYKFLMMILLIVVSLNSCKEDFFAAKNQDGSKDEFLVFNKKEDFNAALTSCYIFAATQGGAGRDYILTPGFVSQDVIGREGIQVNLNNYMSPNNAQAFEQYWYNSYRGVAAANLLIDRIAQIKPGILTPDEIKLYNAQAKFMRGLAYFIIARAFGDVPMPLEEYTSSQNKMSCTPNAQVFQQVVKDLSEAAADLPEAGNYLPRDRGRASKGAALAYLANAYMYLKDWPKAKKATEDLMALTKPKYEIPNDLRAAFTYLYKDEPEYLKEVIFDVQFKRGKDWTIYGRSFTEIDLNGSFMGSNTAPRFIGPRFDTNAGWGEANVNMKAINSFEPNDLRGKIMTIPWGSTTYEGEYFPGPLTQADWDKTYLKNCGFSTKYWLGSYTAGLDTYPQSIPLMRFTEVILNYAEILYKSGEQTEAYKQLNKIRARAELADLPVSSSEATFMQNLMDERRHELIMEPNLWFHYTRTGLAAKFLKDNYDITMKPEWNYFPIPIRERTLNPNICSNGY